MVEALLFHFIVEGKRRPYLAAIEKGEIRGHHADHREVCRIERQRPAHDVRICAESALPQAVFENDHLIAPRLILARQKCAPEGRFDA